MLVFLILSPGMLLLNRGGFRFSHLILILSIQMYIGLVYLFFGFYLDGVTVAKAITLKDKFENLGAR